MFALRQKYEDESNDLMQGSVKLILNSLFGIQKLRIINELYKGKSQHWMETEYDDNVLEYSKLQNGNYIVKLKNDETDKKTYLYIKELFFE